MKISPPESSKIAVVEEAADNIYSVRFILQSLGYQVQSIAYGPSYLPKLKQLEPGLIIVDMLIPQRGGFEVIRGVQSTFKKTPVLAITADAMDGEEAEVRAAGASEILNKPYTVTDLQEKLKKYLG